MKEIFINVDSCNSESIKTIQGNNNAEFYKIYLLENKRRLSLVGKTVKFGYVMNGTSKGDIIEDLNISNAEQGEITFPITNKISKKDGVYTCQLAIYGADEFLEYTATFGLTVQANIFTKIAGEIADTKDLTYIERILEEAKIVSGDLKTNIPVATNLNSSLENNTSNARNINTTLADTAEKSKVAASDAIEKKSQLESSINKAKEFIEGLDGSQNIPGIRMELTELQNGLKSNQDLEYSGSSITAKGTLEGRTERMKIGGITLLNCILTPVINRTYTGNSTQQMYNYKVFRKANTIYTIVAFISKNTLNNNFSLLSWGRTSNGNPISITAGEKGLIKKSFTTNDNTEDWFLELWKENSTGEIKIDYMMVLEGDWTNKDVPSYFEGIKSLGEAEREGDKYKISILSHSENLVDTNDSSLWQLNKGLWSHGNGENPNLNGGMITDYIDINYIKNVTIYLRGKVSNYFFCFYDENKKALMNITKVYLKPSNAKFIRFFVIVNEDNTPLTTFINPQLMLSYDTYKDYEPYKCDKKDILLKEPLRGFDENTCDVMYEDNGQVKVTRNIDTYTFTGDEIMRDTTEQDEKSGTGKYKVFALTVNKTIDIDKNINNNFPKNQFNVAFQNMDSEGLAVTQYGVYIKILKSKLSTQDTEGFKAWLKANTTTIYFARATPVTEIVENCVDIDLDTYKEKTYFNILNSLPGTLDFKVPSNIGSLVQSNAKEINNINEFINNFILKALLEMNKDLAAIKIKNGLN